VRVSDPYPFAGPGRGESVSAATTDELLVRVGRGDQAAFESLYDRIAGVVFGVVRRVVRDPAQAEEVTQEVLVEVWRTAPRFDPDRGAATSWVLTMAHRRAVDRVRSAQASADRDARAARLEQTPEYDAVSDTVELGMERDEVRKALGSLTALQREAVALAYYGGLTQREVADRLGVPLGTVKTRLRDGLTRLRDALGVTS
jgi:RNA polymerase sigma-70 factor (ECF subfamily)